MSFQFVEKPENENKLSKAAMSLADELLADLEDDNEELEEEVKIKVEDEDDGKSIGKQKLLIVS